MWSHNTAADTLRRLFDIMTAVVGLILLSPVLLGVALAVKLDSAGPVFYRAKRVGRDGALFELLKFRSMTADADRQGPGITAAGDRRITRVGNRLRRTKLDELPQLINVLKGEMSLVGPRPEDPRYVALYSAEQRQILDVRPGITSQASLVYRHEEALLIGNDWEDMYRSVVMPEKLSIDLEYLATRTFWSDLLVLLKTVRTVFD
jgi:lipopolysaccharide/colanic/teichoic acid biosynthesis glycosyltransferase